MNRTQLLVFAIGIVSIEFAGAGLARAQHFDILIQQVDSQLVTGTADFDTNEWYLGRRVWFRDFDTDFAINNPGFNALGSSSPSLPAGSQALPGNTALSWDFLPMTIDSVSQNLFYWNGLETDGVPGLTPEDVLFGPLPGPNYLVSLFDKANAKHSVNGANVIVLGGVIDDTAADGVIHRHRFFFLEDGDGSGATTPADGIYLLAMRLRMVGLLDSVPIYMVFGTPGSSVAALDNAAVPWVEKRVDELVPIRLPGDYNEDGMVDAADYTVWRDTLESMTELAADGNGSSTVDAEDYNVWKANYGRMTGSGSIEALSGYSASKLLTASVPEPSSGVLALTILSGWPLLLRSRPVFQNGSSDKMNH